MLKKPSTGEQKASITTDANEAEDGKIAAMKVASGKRIKNLTEVTSG